MSVTGTMYTGISGMHAASQGLSVVSNNLANVDTVGFKGSKTTFEDAFYQAVNSAQGVSQVGSGVAISAIYGDFSQGPYESSTEATDLAIGGNGFFQLVSPSDDTVYYSRAGDFRFDSGGYLVDSHGYRVQGWAAETTTDGQVQAVGSPTDVLIDDFQSPPSPTTTLTMALNLDSTSTDKSTNAADPFFALYSNWDGTAEPPLGDSLYAYQTTIKTYDENGSAFDLTVYYDPVDSSDYVNGDSGSQAWEFIVTCEPGADGRTIDGQALGDTSSAGMLMTGVMTFDASGQLTGMTSYTLKDTATGDLSDLDNWELADMNEDGLTTFTANFTGASDASATNSAQAQSIAIDFGMNAGDVSGTGWQAGTSSNAGSIGTDYSDLGGMADAELGTSPTTSYNAESSTLSQSQDGYASGFLQDISVDRDGVVTGSYSNGQIEDLYVLVLADFANEDGLQREGGNLFSQTRDSGEALTGTANSGSLGSISSNTLEQSNVDMATEMVRMITLQRAYDASSKVISTADTMMSTVIALKR